MFEIRKNLDLKKILVTPKNFLKSRFHCTSLKGFPFKRGEICYKYVHIKTGIMKCILLQSFHLKDERLSHVDCNTRVSIVGCKPYTIQANDG